LILSLSGMTGTKMFAEAGGGICATDGVPVARTSVIAVPPSSTLRRVSPFLSSLDVMILSSKCLDVGRERGCTGFVHVNTMRAGRFGAF
jgi:hypothetical protein